MAALVAVYLLIGLALSVVIAAVEPLLLLELIELIDADLGSRLPRSVLVAGCVFGHLLGWTLLWPWPLSIYLRCRR
jgi:hypothetical protein